MEQSKPEIAKESTTPAAENNRKELSSIPKTEKEKIEIYSYTERRSKGTEAGRNVL